jgi:hypothetical protein
MSEPKATERAICLFREQGGTLRTSEALRLGIRPRALYALRDAGDLEPLVPTPTTPRRRYSTQRQGSVSSETRSVSAPRL